MQFLRAPGTQKTEKKESFRMRMQVGRARACIHNLIKVAMGNEARTHSSTLCYAISCDVKINVIEQWN